MRRTAGAVSGTAGGQWREGAYAGHNRIWQQGLEGDAHGCGGCVGVLAEGSWLEVVTRFAA